MTALSSFEARTRSRDDWMNITGAVAQAVRASGVTEGICVVFVPHTTAAVTVNENADPDVPRDARLQLASISPDRPEFRHSEGNSDAHVKTSLIGPSVVLIVHRGELLLGTWQGIWLTEFDGPRTRTVHVRTMGE